MRKKRKEKKEQRTGLAKLHYYLRKQKPYLNLYFIYWYVA